VLIKLYYTYVCDILRLGNLTKHENAKFFILILFFYNYFYNQLNILTFNTQAIIHIIYYNL